MDAQTAAMRTVLLVTGTEGLDLDVAEVVPAPVSCAEEADAALRLLKIRRQLIDLQNEYRVADAHIGRSQAEIAKMEHQLQDDGLPEWVRADLAARVQEAHQRIAHARQRKEQYRLEALVYYQMLEA